MKKLLLFAVFIISLTVLSAFAYASGRTVGNGGNVVICDNDGVKTYEVLDFYEARVLRNVQIDFDLKGDTFESKAQFLIKRLERVSSVRAQLYQQFFQNFKQEVFWLKEGELNDISDSDHITKPPQGCSIKQVVNQSNPVMPMDKRYFIDQKIWDKMTDTQRVGLVMHEIIYREAISLGHTNSVSTRYLNSIISSGVMDEMSELGFAQILRDLGFQSSKVQGVEVNLDKKYEVYSNGQLKKATVKEGSIYSLFNQQISLRDEISFYENGQVERLFLADMAQLKINELNFDLFPYELSFYENGQLKSCTLAKELLLSTNQYQLQLTGVIEFFDNGILKIGYVVKGQFQLQNFFQPSVVSIEGPIQFYASGGIQNFTTNDLIIYQGLNSTM